MDMAKPIIRFKGYQDDWEQRKLGDIATFINGRAYSQDELLSSGKYKVLRVGNFYTNDSWYYSDMELDDKYYVEEGDLLYTWSATFGPHIWHGDKIIYHYHIWKVELSNALEKNFAVQLMEKDKQSILSDKNGSTMVHITKSGMESKEVILPSNIKEQAKIGEYFYSLDYLITLHQRKCDETKKLKKYMLQKMFPQNGEKVPEIRFSGFTDDWEQRKLSQVVDSIDTGKSKYNVLENGEYKILGSTGTIGYDNSYDYDGDFLLTARVGANAGTLYRHHGKVKITDNTVFLQGNQIDFIYYLLDRFDLKRLSFGSGQPLIKASELKNLELQMPITKEEKDKIANYFVCIDHLITLHQRELENLQNIKKFMLEKMFV